jgi:hypothetical protein
MIAVAERLRKAAYMMHLETETKGRIYEFPSGVHGGKRRSVSELAVA